MQEVAEQIPDPLVFTEAAASKVKELIEDENNEALMLRVFISGGGCSGFQVQAGSIELAMLSLSRSICGA